VSPVVWRRTWRYAPLLLLLIAVVLLAGYNLGYPGVWYDETVQIWVAQGVHPLAPVGETLGSWRDVVRMNRRANLDPGGFSLWLHLWSKGGHGLAWLRLSAYIFFLLAGVLLARWAFELTGSALASGLAALIPLAYGLVLSFAFEIRAYSMEIAGVVASGYALHRAARDPSLVNHLVLGAVCSVFLWSRYSFVVMAAATLGALVCVRIRDVGRSRDELEKLACLLVPLLNSAALIYRFTLRYQTDLLHLGRSHPLGSTDATIQAPEYVKQWVLRGQPSDALGPVLRENFLTAPALPILLTLCALGLWPLLRHRRELTDWPGSQSFAAIATMALLAQLFSAALSLAGWYPWYMGEKWSLYLHAVSIVCVLYLAAACWHLARRSRAAPSVAAAAIALSVILTVRGAAFHRTHWADVSPALAELDTMSLRQGSVFVSIYDVPTLRYFYELGPQRGRGAYPDAFRFERYAESTVIDARQECLEFVLSPLDLDTLARRLPGTRLTRVPGPASTSLSRIDIDGPRPPHCAARGTASARG
jgi:hypothetical protein